MSTATLQDTNSLSPARLGLVHLMNRIDYGRIEQLVVRDCDPVLEPRPHTVLERKLGHRARCRPVANQEDFVLKDQVIDLFGYFDRIVNGVIEKVEIQAGLPFRIHVPDSVTD